MIPNAIALFGGEATIALPTIPTHVKTKRIVVNGCPGTRKVTVSDADLTPAQNEQRCRCHCEKDEIDSHFEVQNLTVCPGTSDERLPPDPEA